MEIRELLRQYTKIWGEKEAAICTGRLGTVSFVMEPGGRHRNSQKRYYIDNAVYFITTVTHQRFPYFIEPLLLELFVHDLLFAAKLKECDILGYTVMPDHVHLLLRPRGKWNISKFMATLKRNVARDINIILSNGNVIRNLIEVADSNPRLHDNFQITHREHPHITIEDTNITLKFYTTYNIAFILSMVHINQYRNSNGKNHTTTTSFAMIGITDCILNTFTTMPSNITSLKKLRNGVGCG